MATESDEKPPVSAKTLIVWVLTSRSLDLRTGDPLLQGYPRPWAKGHGTSGARTDTTDSTRQPDTTL